MRALTGNGVGPSSIEVDARRHRLSSPHGTPPPPRPPDRGPRPCCRRCRSADRCRCRGRPLVVDFRAGGARTRSAHRCRCRGRRLPLCQRSGYPRSLVVGSRTHGACTRFRGGTVIAHRRLQGLEVYCGTLLRFCLGCGHRPCVASGGGTIVGWGVDSNDGSSFVGETLAVGRGNEVCHARCHRERQDERTDRYAQDRSRSSETATEHI
jgi:hypothetical protein